jgi:predicted nucleic acid-binding protein
VTSRKPSPLVFRPCSRAKSKWPFPAVVLQELLSGVAEQKQGERVLAAIRESFPVVLATEGDHLKAADLGNLAARKGVALSTPDALIAAQAFNRRALLFTTDGDFPRLAALAGLKLY